MTTDELGQLFPIIIVDYNPDWPKLASIESRKHHRDCWKRIHIKD